MNRERQKQTMRERILAVADGLFYGRGILATGVDTIAAEVGISKRTLYNHFPSKDALIEAYLERRMHTNRTTDEPPAAQILGVFDRVARGIQRGGFRGCAFVNAVSELGAQEGPAGPLARSFKEGQRLWVRGLLETTPARNPDLLATQIAILVDGAIAGALVRCDVAPVFAARDAARVLLDANGALPPLPEKTH